MDPRLLPGWTVSQRPKGRADLVKRLSLLGWYKGAAISPLPLLPPWLVLAQGLGSPRGPVRGSILFLEVVETEGKVCALTSSQLWSLFGPEQGLVLLGLTEGSIHLGFLGLFKAAACDGEGWSLASFCLLLDTL